MNWKQWFGVSLILLFTVIGGRWVWGYWSEQSQVNKVERLRDELFSEASRELPEEDRRARWEELRAEAERLSPEQRDRLRDEGRQRWEQHAEQRLTEFFALAPAERKAELDRQIDQMEAWRKRAEQRRNSEEGRSGGRGGPGRGQDGASAGASADGPGTGGGSSRFRSRSSDPERRNERRRERLDSTTPEQRARWTEYRRQLTERRAERGLPPFGMGRR